MIPKTHREWGREGYCHMSIVSLPPISHVSTNVPLEAVGRRYPKLVPPSTVDVFRLDNRFLEKAHQDSVDGC